MLWPESTGLRWRRTLPALSSSAPASFPDARRIFRGNGLHMTLHGARVRNIPQQRKRKNVTGTECSISLEVEPPVSLPPIKKEDHTAVVAQQLDPGLSVERYAGRCGRSTTVRLAALHDDRDGGVAATDQPCHLA